MEVSGVRVEEMGRVDRCESTGSSVVCGVVRVLLVPPTGACYRGVAIGDAT